MKLVETDVELENEDVAEVPRPPRPEHRKAYVSLALTAAVLVGTVAAVYVLFPKRDHEVIEQAIEAHRAPGDFALTAPGPAELTAFTLGVLARPVRWPAAAGDVTIEGAARLTLLRRDAAMVRYRIGGDPVTLIAMEPWDAPRRVIVRDAGEERAVWWRSGPWTMIAVGPAARADAWRPRVGAP